MSVEKFKVTKEDSCYTTLPNLVLQNLHNLEALGLWCYFQSKPPQWEFNKKDIRSMFQIGIHKLENICKVLKQHNLIEIHQERNKKGCFDTWNLHVKNGQEFTFIPISKNCSTVQAAPRLDSHRAPENRATDNRATVNSTYKRKIKKLKSLSFDSKKDKEKKREREENNPPLSLDDLKNEKNEKICEDKNLDLNDEIEKYSGYCKDKLSNTTQAGFRRWLLNAHPQKYKKEKNQITEINDPHSDLFGRFFSTVKVTLEEIANQICKDYKIPFDEAMKNVCEHYQIR